MFGSYGSYSSMSSASQPIDISPSSSGYSSPTNFTSCAYPSWPQGPSLAQSPEETRATSYLSDDDLFPCGDLEYDSHSSSSSSCGSADSPFVTEEEMMQMRRQQQMMLQREALKYVVAEKERRRKAAKKARATGSSSSSAKKSPKSKLQGMTPISEACE